jgi:hypothetical protein
MLPGLDQGSNDRGQSRDYGSDNDAKHTDEGNHNGVGDLDGHWASTPLRLCQNLAPFDRGVAELGGNAHLPMKLSVCYRHGPGISTI